MAKILKYLLIIVSIPVIALVAIILYASITDYRPPELEIISSGRVTPVLNDSSTVTMLIWNIGYAGLDKEMDFFYDGGKQVRTSNNSIVRNFTEIRSYLKGNDSVDFILLQEIDVRSRRSYQVNQVMQVAEDLNEHKLFFGTNYDVFFVPLPFSNPMGPVKSGLASLTRYTPSQVERYSFPGNYAWPKKLFMLDRCFMVMHIPVGNGRELLVVNTHNEAYDDGSIRDTQMNYLKEFLLSEYSKGNYVIVGGDWNQCPPDFKPRFTGEIFDTLNNKGISADYLPDDWQWVYDSGEPTNRRVDIPYTKGRTMTTLIDFYLLSPNIRHMYIRTSDLDFENSDHQPVILKISFQ
jgi:endonuclease/exonuclease/phosphatase family metal-dependent hydrolase